MATYVIGDIQGCFAALQTLLKKINFSSNDRLWLTGDIVNRGHQSLETLRFVKNLGSQCITVLGNHDLHLLARAKGYHPGWKEDTFDDILKAPDCDELLHWLSMQPLLHHVNKVVMVHAGLFPFWDLNKAISLANEVEKVLQDENQAPHFFQHMYGNSPSFWSDELQGIERLRTITNIFTRIRFCDQNGHLNFNAKGTLDSNPDLIPWFKFPNRSNTDLTILFGHWAALGGETQTPYVFALDTGCVWGYCLTALRLEDFTHFSVKC